MPADVPQVEIPITTVPIANRSELAKYKAVGNYE